MERIKISRVLTAALATVVAQATRLAQALVVPAVVYVAMSLVPSEPETITGGLFFIMGLVTIVLHTVVAITTHRIVILGPDSVPKLGLTRWTRRETTFLLYIFGFALAISLLVMFGAALPQPFGLAIVAGIAIIIFSAASLVFPAVALEHETSVQTAWQLAQGNFFPLIVCVWLFPIAISIPIGALSFIPYAAPLIAVLHLTANVLTIAALSLAYSEISKNAGLWKSD